MGAFNCAPGDDGAFCRFLDQIRSDNLQLPLLAEAETPAAETAIRLVVDHGELAREAIAVVAIAARGTGLG